MMIENSSKRNMIDISASILYSLSKSPLRKTHLLYEAKLDSRTASKYLSIMQELGMIKKTGKGSKYFMITEKGSEFINKYEALKSMLH